jgi:threonine/homoserine/homoserine lactone efflux protein
MIESVVALLQFLFPLAWSPGPGNMSFAALGAGFGAQATAPASFGYHLATLLVTFAIGLGFSATATRLGAAFDLIRFAGALYVLWLAARLWRAGAEDAAQAPRPADVVDGAVLLLLNPKAYVIIMLMFAQFLPPAAPASAAAAIAILFTLNNLVAFTAWTLVGDALMRLFATERSARGINRVFAGILAGVAVWMAAR